MKIIVLSITQYKEKDGIVDAISENGDITFLAKGIFDPKNKNAALNNSLVTADIELQEGNYKYPVLKSSSVIDNPMKLQNDLDYLTSLMLIAEMTKQLLQDEEKTLVFDSLLAAIHALKQVETPWAILLAYTAKILKVSGYEFEVNRCVFCGTTSNIVTFSFNDGGFVCQECLEEDTERDLTKEQMLLIRAAFNVNDISAIKYNCKKEDALKVLSKFLEFISDSYGITLKSTSLL